jgi:hypothetical protein
MAVCYMLILVVVVNGARTCTKTAPRVRILLFEKFQRQRHQPRTDNALWKRDLLMLFVSKEENRGIATSFQFCT